MKKQKLSVVEQRILSQKEKILEHLTESGNVSFACKRVGLERKTFYRWIEADSIFSDEASEAIALGKSYLNDLAQTHLIRNIQEGDMQAIRLQLVSCHDDYRIRPPIRMDDHPAPVAVIHITQVPDRVVKSSVDIPVESTVVEVVPEIVEKVIVDEPDDFLPKPLESSNRSGRDESLPC